MQLSTVSTVKMLCKRLHYPTQELFHQHKESLCIYYTATLETLDIVDKMTIHTIELKRKSHLGAVAYACNPSTSGGWGEITWGQEFETSLANMVKPVSTKITKKLARWQRVPVIPATWEAEATESLESGRHRLQWAKIMPLHSSLGDKSETLSQKNKNKRICFKSLSLAKWQSSSQHLFFVSVSVSRFPLSVSPPVILD